ncbi:MAG: Stk1 family PASTA domain-containing Ser/Thr kinase [Oscillospiraceae bacterium]|jgi:serine/threonine-protein kinase|nr:Stk1 family PASTA domain-containing Ser/Thr kinase [Oscillospiraceae bacterium]
MDSTDKYIGMMLDNRYEILERIGAGGMAYVYKARCHRLNRLVAVKILKEELAGNEEFRRRFHTESQAVAMLSHPNIVAVYDVSRSGSIEYIVMELIEGITLKQYINRKGLLNWKESLHFATQITKALCHAHSKGIIHRDIKPHNTMILKDGSVKVADFGIAQLLSMQSTLTQEALGSVHYISPEQAKGGHVDARTDIYSVGVVMYEMITSRLPFVGDSAVSIAIQHISAMPLLPRDINPDIPEGLENITMHAMEADLSLRYATADEMLMDLEEFRKNPAAVFSYASSEVASAEREDITATKAVPTGGAIERVAAISPRRTRPPKRPEMSRDEYRSNRRRASQTTTLVGVMAIILFLIFICFFMWTYFFKDMLDPDVVSVRIPNFIGLKYSQVRDDPEYREYCNFLEPKFVSSDSYGEGYIVEQNPQAERQLNLPPNGIDVTLTVSTGKPPDVLMPDVVNKNYMDARVVLEALGLDLDIRDERVMNDDVTPDYVIETKPAAGEPLARGRTVHMIYSAGPEIIYAEVPSVVGLHKDVGERQLEVRNLAVKIEYVDDDAKEGEIIFQNIEPRSKVPERTEVLIQVSKGPQETPSPTPTPTEAPTPTPTETPPPAESPTPSPDPSGGTGDPEITGIPPDISGGHEAGAPADTTPSEDAVD